MVVSSDFLLFHHREPPGRRNAPPDNRLREAIHLLPQNGLLRRFASRNDG
jgi:hypothetical protein